MKSKYEVRFVAKDIKQAFEFNPETKEVYLSKQARELREDLRSIVIDEAIRAGEYFEELSQLPAEEKEQQNIKQTARERARKVSLKRYGNLREEAFKKLKGVNK